MWISGHTKIALSSAKKDCKKQIRKIQIHINTAKLQHDYVTIHN